MMGNDILWELLRLKDLASWREILPVPPLQLLSGELCHKSIHYDASSNQVDLLD